MDWIIACITITSMELIARKHWYGWALGLVNQFLWAWLLVYQKQLYGLALIPMVLIWRYTAARLYHPLVVPS